MISDGQEVRDRDGLRHLPELRPVLLIPGYSIMSPGIHDEVRFPFHRQGNDLLVDRIASPDRPVVADDHEGELALEAFRAPRASCSICWSWAAKAQRDHEKNENDKQ